MYHFFKNNKTNKYFVYFLVLSFFNSGYFAYSNELLKNYIKVKWNPQAINHYVGNAQPIINPTNTFYNEVASKTDINKEATAKVKFVNSDNTNMVYASDIKEGNIGISKKGDFDFIYDNIFKVNINDKELAGKEIYLSYDIKGIDKSTLPSRSINFNKVVGGYVVKFSNEWQNVEEKMSATWLKNGVNTIFFTLPNEAVYNYKIKNLKIFTKAKSENHIIELKNLIAFKNDNKNIYLNGFINLPSQLENSGYTLTANDKPVNITENQFEEKFANVANKEVVLKLFHNNIIVDIIEIKAAQFIKADRNYNVEPLDAKTSVASNVVAAKNYAEYESKKHAIAEVRLIDIPQFESSFINVTKNKTAYRVTNLKVKDSTAFKLFMEYDASLIPNGYTEKDIQTFHFDADYKKWIPVEKDSLMVSDNVIVALSDKGGDYVNGIIQVPESPQTSSYTPTMMSDIKAADPSSGMTLISPPEVSQKGEANISYPIKIPAGRNGVQPNVSINYSSDGGNGWLGEGWGISTPAITIDTKWGVPTFDPTKESEIYNLNGEQLMYPKEKGQDWMPNRHQVIGGLYTTDPKNRTSNLNFTPRKQGSFTKIERLGSNTTDYYWKVTSTDGTVSWYGGKNSVEPNAVIKNVQNNIVHWALYMVEDVHGNNIKYIYNKQNFTTGIDANENLNGGLVYNLSKIKYTGHNGSDGVYSVDFINETTITRPDISINNKFGLKQIMPYKLNKIVVSLNSHQIRSYKLEYALGKFEKTILKKIIEQDKNSANLYEHVFDYYNDVADNILFEKSREIQLPDVNPDYLLNFGDVQNASYLNTSQKTEMGWDVRPAFGFELFYKTNKPQRKFTFGLPFGESYPRSKGKVVFADINGDGLDDILYKKNDKLFYKSRLNSYDLDFGGDTELFNINEFSKNKGKTKTMFLESFDFMYGNFYIGKKRFKSAETTSIYMNDSNGDQLPDIVRDGVVYFNNGANTFETSSANTPNMLITADIYQKEVLPDPEPEPNDFDYSKYDVVRIWEAPYDGNITINDNIEFFPTTSSSSTLFSIETQLSATSAVPFRIYLKQFNFSNTSEVLNITNYSGNNPPLGNSLSGFAVKKGQKIFFRVQKNSDAVNDILQTSPIIKYISNTDYSDANGYSTKKYDHAIGFKLNSDTGEVLVEETGTVTINWSDLPLNLTDDVKFRIVRRDFNESGIADESVVYESDYLANTNSILYGENLTQNIDISDGKRGSVGFYFEVISDSNVNWNAVDWYPEFHFTPSNSTSLNGGLKYAIPTHTIYQEANDVNIRNVGNNLQGNYIFKCTPVNYQNVSNDNVYYVKPITAISTSTNPYSFLPTDSGFFTLVVKKNGILLGKRKVAINQGVFSIDDSNPIAFTTLNSTELNGISFEYYVDGETNLKLFYKYTNQVSYDSSCGVSNETFNFTPNAANIIIGTSSSFANGEANSPFSQFRRILIHPCINTNKNLGPMHRNWGQFLYNSGFNKNITIPSDQYGKLIDIADLKTNVNQFNDISSNCEVYIDNQEAYENCINSAINNTFNPPAEGGISPENIGGISDTFFNNPYFDNFNMNVAFMQMVAKIETNLSRRWNGIFQNQYSEVNKINTGNTQSGYFPEDYFGNEGEESPPLQSNLFTGMFAVDKEHRSVSVSYSGGYGQFNASASNSRYSNLVSDFTDINGDNYPDILTTNSFFKTTMTGGHRSLGNGFGIVNASDSNNFALGLSKSYPIAGRGGTKSKKQDNGNPSFSAGIGIGLNLYGSNKENNTLIDINGDGLVDVFNNANGYKIRFNYGNNFGANNEPFTYLNPIETKPTALDAPSLNLSLNSAADANIPFSISAGYSSTSGNTSNTYIDLNGDSLPDLLTFSDNIAKVRFNLGNKFSNTTIDIKYDTISPLLNLLKNNKSSSASIQGNLSLFWGTCILWLVIPIPPVFVIVIPFLFFKAGATVGGNANLTISENNKEFKDMNGDGFLDFVENTGNTAKIYNSKIGRTNKLSTVNNPLGGSFVINYEKQPVTFDNPHAKWAMTAVTVNDGRDLPNDGADVFTKSFVYSNGKYDRRERAFYGYETVEVNEVLNTTTSRKSVTKYHNKSYFLEGLVKETAVYKVFNSTPELYSTSENTYEVRETKALDGTFDFGSTLPLTFDVGGKEGRRQAGVLLTKSVNKVYEFGTTPITSEIVFKYDGFGRVEEYTNKGDISNPNDDYKSVINYHSGLNNNLINIPKKIEVFTGPTLANLVRQREITNVNTNTGAILTVKTKLNINEYAQTDMTYDVYGNLKTIAYPQTSFGQMTYNYTYDTTLNKYLIEVKDAFGYKSSSTYDYNFDVVLNTTDRANNVINYQYDNIGRLTKIIAPKEAYNSDPYTISFQYMPTYSQAQVNGYGSFVTQNNFIPFAVTKHYDTQHPTDPIETINFIDGLGKNIQVKKDIEVNTGSPQEPNYEQKMSVSGYVTNDVWGRAIKSYQPRSEDKNNTINFLINQAATPNTSFNLVEYDVLDRTTKTIDMEGNESVMSYTIANDPFGTLALKTKSQVQQNNTTLLINESFTDIKGQNISTLNAGSIKTKFDYDAIGQLMAYTDDQNINTTYKYDVAGRKTQVTHPDSGTTKYQYDEASNLTKVQTANLEQQGTAIEYYYDINRVSKIRFPDVAGVANVADVTYQYGLPNIGNSSGRLIEQNDATGKQVFTYGVMGETTLIDRTIKAPNLPTRLFSTRFSYDSFNRIQNLTYPDGEIVTYSYNKGGNLNKMTTQLNGQDYEYVKQIDYDYFEQKTYMKYGNNTETFYNYSQELRRLQNLNVTTADGQSMFNNVYSFDKVGNITKITNEASYNTTNYLGGTYNHNYAYDNLNRLSRATGSFSGHTKKNSVGFSEYNLDMEYNTTHGITQKKQFQTAQNGAPVYQNSYTNGYEYMPETHKVTSITNAENSTTENFEYDANGNTIYNHNQEGFRKMYWDESNRLRVVNDNDHQIQHYIYDGAGERILKASSQIETVYENGQVDANTTTMGLYTTYVSPYMVVDANQKYSKHYFNGTQRVASKIGEQDITMFDTNNPYLKQANSKAAENTPSTDFDALKNKQITDFSYYLSKNGTTTKNVKINYTEYKKADTNTQTTLAKAADNNSAFAAPQYAEIYYYHSDHLGTGTFLSDFDGNPYQFFLNLPFGETMAEQHSYSGEYTNRYKFNGKELDEETGFYYYGARYYNPKFSIWLSVDPLAEKFPNASPYNYCLGNPINLVDPDGRAPSDWFKNAAGRIVWFDSESKSFKDKSNVTWTNIGSTKNDVKKYLNVPTNINHIEWTTMSAFLFDGQDNSGKKLTDGKTFVTIAPLVFNHTASVSYDLSMKGTEQPFNQLVSGKSEITGVNVNVTLTSETAAPGTSIQNVSGYFGIKKWTPTGKDFIYTSSEFMDAPFQMLSKFPYHASGVATMNLSLGTYKKFTNSSTGFRPLDLDFNTQLLTKNTITGDKEVFNTDK